MGLYNEEYDKALDALIKVYKLLDDLKEKLSWIGLIPDPSEIDEHKEALYKIAYFFKVEIIDRIEKNNWSWLMSIGFANYTRETKFNRKLTRYGYTKNKKETFHTAWWDIIWKLQYRGLELMCLSKNKSITRCVDNILDGKGIYYKSFKKLSKEQIRQFLENYMKY